MSKYLTELQAEISKVEGYIEVKQSSIENYKNALNKEELDLKTLQAKRDELKKEQNYLVEFGKWKEDKMQTKVVSSVEINDDSGEVKIKGSSVKTNNTSVKEAKTEAK